MRFTVATLNAGGFKMGTYWKDISQDRPTIGRLLGARLRDYDVVLLQEIYNYWGDGMSEFTMIRAHSGHQWGVWHPTTRITGGWGGQAILSKHPIEEKIRHLSWEKPKETSSPPEGWVLQYAKIRIGGAPVHFFNAHYQHEPSNMRSAGLTMIELIAELPKDASVVFGADFNAGACSGEAARMLERGVLELASGTGQPDIDHILSRHIRVYGTFKDGLVVDGKTLSDHELIGLDGEARVSNSTLRATILAGPPQPPKTHPSRSATFTFSADRPGSTFECWLNCAAFQPCTSPMRYDNLPNGQHWFAVRATDQEGNRQPMPTGWTWIVSEPPPTVVVPDVVGLRPSTARKRLSLVGLKAASTGGGNPEEVVVAAQKPKAGARVPRGSIVTLVLGDASELQGTGS